MRKIIPTSLNFNVKFYYLYLYFQVHAILEESQSLKKLYSFFQVTIYGLVLLEALMYVYYDLPQFSKINPLMVRLQSFAIFNNIIYSKSAILLLILITSIGTKPRKTLKPNTTKGVLIPLGLGILFIISSILFYIQSQDGLGNVSGIDTIYGVTSLLGTILLHSGLDNCSKTLKNRLLDDRFNMENESFEQSTIKIDTKYSINIPTKFHYLKKAKNGWLNVTNPFRGTIVLGTPGSGKSYSIIRPAIKQFIRKKFSLLIYDFKYPDLAQTAYYHYLLSHSPDKQGNRTFEFHMVNLMDLEYSRRVNPLAPQYIETLADAIETAESMIESLRKSSEMSGDNQFFTQSAINYLSACIFFLSKYENGKYSTLPHVMALLNRSYDEIFNLLLTNDELESLLSPFRSAYDNKAFNQLEGQIGTLKVNISRINTKESAWVFSGQDFNLSLSNPNHPSLLIITNNPKTQSINSASNSVLLNRVSKLVNTRGNHPCGIIIDELPTIYFHRIQNLISTARSHKVAVVLGIQELPQLVEGYGKTGAETILAVIGNVISGAARKKETIDWLEKLFGKIKQIKKGYSVSRGILSTSYNEQSDYLIPASKIADLQAGQIVGKLAQDALSEKQLKKFRPGLGTYNCRIDLDVSQIENEKREFVSLPKYYDFEGKKEEILIENFQRIKSDIQMIINDFTENQAKKFAEGEASEQNN